MKRGKRFFLAVFAVCVMLAVSTFTVACRKKAAPEGPVDPEGPADPTTYAVTYSLGSCEGTAYAGTSTLPTESAKAEGATFALAAAPVWEGYAFEGWSDGTNSYDASAQYTMPGAAVTFTAVWEKTYAVTYAGGSYEDTPYAGTSAIPTENRKKAGAPLTLADALVWEGYTFEGWYDGTTLHKAGEQMAMPAAAVTFTAVWDEAPPKGYIKEKNLPVWTWDDKSVTPVGYTLGRGETVTFSASFTNRITKDGGNGPVAQVFANNEIGNGNTFYIFNAYNARKVTNGDWDWWVWETIQWERNEWDDKGMDAVMATLTSGTAHIAVTLNSSGALIEAYTMYNEAGERLYTCTYTVVDQAMDSALVRFAADKCTAEPATIVYPKNVQLVFDHGYDGKVETHYALVGSTYTFGSDPNRTNYFFRGWQVSGEGAYYAQGNTYALGTASVRFVATWVQGVKVTVDKDGASGTPSTPYPLFNAETGQFDIRTYPSFSESSFKKTGYAFKFWEVSVNDLVQYEDIAGAFSVAPGSTVVFKAIWGTPLTLQYALGTCEGTKYGGTPKSISSIKRAAGGKVVLSDAPVWGGYTFLGWSADGGTTLYEANAKYVMPDQNTTLTAYWQKRPHYAVTFEGGSYEGTPYGGQNLIDARADTYEGGTFTLARALKWEGYVFLGWKTEGDERVYAANYMYTMPGHAVTFTAVWEKLPTHTVTYDAGAGGEQVYNMPSNTYYETQVVMQLPIRFGYTFKGWKCGETVYQAGDTLPMTEDGITLTAQWEALGEENAQFALLSGVWTYESANGTVYIQISGMEGAWDSFKATGSYKVGAITVTSVTATQIKFSIKANRPTGSGTNTISCTYTIATDTFSAGSYGTYTRSASAPKPTTGADTASTASCAALETTPVQLKKRGYEI